MAKEQKNKREIYTLNDLPPEVVAVTFAKCSRSPESFQDIADELTDELSADFSEKWIVGYGHSSVAEHAVLSLAIENVSILATKVIEDNRLCSYTEKSTRYQIYDRDKYYQPKNVLKSKHEKLYRQTCDFLMDTYNNLYEPMNEFLVKKYPREKDVAEKLHAARLKAKTCDNVRYILPVATLTNLGMTANARNLEYAIAKMLSHPLEEIQQIGEEIKTAATKVTPTLIKYANANEYLTETTKELNDIVQKTLPIHNIETSKPVELIDYDQDADDKLVTALLYRFSD